MKRLYCPFIKTKAEDDGTLKVWGYASTGTMDDDGETILPAAIKAALPDYLKWGAVREMHQPKAVGTAIEADVQADGRTWFGAHVVDPIAVKKIQNNVLKGFSVGGRITERDEVEKTTITGIKLIEVSLVDRPANPECEIVMVKRAETAEEKVQDLAAMNVSLDALLDAAEQLAKADSDKPYGDVEYADPGYQEDGKKRYPIDTEAHIRAAWSYINKEKNQAQYNAAQVKRIKAKIVAAWKKKIDKDGPPSAGEKVAKSLYDVSSFCQALEALAWVCAGAQSDFDWEGDGSPIPEKLRSCMAELADIFAEMAEEEASELVDQLKAQAGEAIERLMKGIDMTALQVGAVLKAGAKYSKETKAAMAAHADSLGKLHKHLKEAAAMCKEACDKMDALMPKDGDGDEDGDGKAATPTTTKAATTDPQTQAEGLAELIKGLLAPLQAELEALKKQPVGGVPFASEAAAAAALAARGLTAVGKAGDLVADPNAPADGAVTAVEIVRSLRGGVDEPLTVMKAMLHPSRAKVMERPGMGAPQE